MNITGPEFEDRFFSYLKTQCDILKYDLYPRKDEIGFRNLCWSAVIKAEKTFQDVHTSIRNKIPREDCFDETTENTLIRSFALAHLRNVLEPSILTVDEIVNSVNGVGIVLIVGAGVSFDTGFNWDTVRAVLALPLVSTGAARADFYKNFFRNMRQFFQQLGALSAADIQKFQNDLTEEVGRRAPGMSHQYIARLISLGKIAQIISFNWDDFIERSYEVRHSAKISPIFFSDSPTSGAPLVGGGYLWKPHGGVNQGDNRTWVYPSKTVRLNKHLKNAHTQPARIVICMGFSGATNFGQSRIEGLFGPGTRIYDVRPQLDPGRTLGTFVGVSAEYLLSRIVAKFDPNFVPGT